MLNDNDSSESCQLENLESIRYSTIPMEKRRYPRVHCELESMVRRIYSGSDPSAYENGSIHDISEGGMRFRCSRFIPVKDVINCRFSFPKSELLETVMNIAWVRESDHLDFYEIGASFNEINGQLRTRLHEFILKQLFS